MWTCHGGTWPGERERAAGQSSPAPAPVAAGRSSLARTGGRAELAFACTCGGRGAAALHAHPWRLRAELPRVTLSTGKVGCRTEPLLNIFGNEVRIFLCKN